MNLFSKITVLLTGILSTAADMELMQVVIVSRHGIRTPYAPPYGTVTDFSAYTNKIFPDNNTWGMTYDAFATQQLTPHGEKVIPFMGAFYADRFVSDGLEVSCSEVTCFADDSGRDITTAHLWLQGFGCPNVDVQVVNATSNADMQPVLSDHFDVGCPLATEEQVDGLYGGDVDALTDMYDEGIQKVMDVLAMPPDASICEDANPDFDPASNCTLFDTGSQWTGLYYEGMFTSPMYYAQYFAEAWMFQYTSNLTEWAFNLLTLDQLSDLYNMHIENLWFGTNYWNSLAYSSQQLAYIVASMNQFVTGKAVKGVHQDPTTKLLLLVSHDTNILYLQRLLGLNWIPLGFSNQVATTGGTLSFELWKESSDGSVYVKIHYDAASPQQQRNAEVLSVNNPPSVADVIIPECGELYCPWETFLEIALSRVDMDCIQQPLQSSSESLLSKASGENNNDDDDAGSLSTVEIAVITAAVCCAVFLLAQVVTWRFWKNKYEAAATREDNRLIDAKPSV